MDETRYLAVNADTFDKLIAETQDLLGRSADPGGVLARWLSLQMAMTVIAVAPGTTADSQEKITSLLATIESLQGMVQRLETEHVDWIGPDGTKTHPDWCRECRVERILFGVNRALTELERHIDQPGTPADLSNVCRRVARYLTDIRGWHAPVEWESRGLQEVRALVSQYVKLDGVDRKLPWISTIEGVKVLLGDLRSMAKTITRRGARYQAAEAKLVRLGQPITAEEREEFARGAEEG